MYNVYLHGIKETAKDIITDTAINPDGNNVVKNGQVFDRGTRISLTIRHVPKVLKIKLGL